MLLHSASGLDYRRDNRSKKPLPRLYSAQSRGKGYNGRGEALFGFLALPSSCLSPLGGLPVSDYLARVFLAGAGTHFNLAVPVVDETLRSLVNCREPPAMGTLPPTRGNLDLDLRSGIAFVPSHGFNRCAKV